VQNLASVFDRSRLWCAPVQKQSNASEN